MKISEYFEVSYKTAEFPKDRRMKVVSENNINGMSSENIRFIMNEICRLYCKDLYVEVGSWEGCSLISSALYNKKAKFIGIDNFSQFEGSLDKIKANIEKMKMKNVSVVEGDYQKTIPEILTPKSIDIYFYDGNHSYQDQIKGLDIIKPYLKDKCIIFVDDSSWIEPQKANNDWLEQNKDFEMITLTINDYSMENTCNNKFWWNGLTIFSRGIDIEI